MISKSKYVALLQSYLTKVSDDTLSIPESLNLLEFYVNDPNVFVEEKDRETGTRVHTYITLGWVMYLLLQQDPSPHSPA